MTMLVELGAIAGLSSVMVVMMMAQPRIFYAMAKDGLLPPFAKKIHPKFRTPHITSIITGVVVAIAAGFTPIGALGELVSIGTLMAFVIVSVGIIFLRYQRPDLERPFKTPLVPLVPILSALVSLGLDGGAAARHLDPADHLDGHRHRDLLRLRVPAQQAAGAIGDNAGKVER